LDKTRNLQEFLQATHSKGRSNIFAAPTWRRNLKTNQQRTWNEAKARLWFPVAILLTIAAPN
jgi:hypothetical protein